MPKHSAEPLGVWCDAFGRNGWNQNAEAGVLARESAIAPYDAEDVSAGGGRGLQSAHDVHRDILFSIAPADGKHQHGVARADARSLQPGGEAGLPAVVIGARGKFGNVVGRSVSLKAAQLAKVVYRVAGMPCRATDAQNEQPPAECADMSQAGCHTLDLRDVDLLEDGDGFGDKRRRETSVSYLLGCGKGTFPESFQKAGKTSQRRTISCS